MGELVATLTAHHRAVEGLVGRIDSQIAAAQFVEASATLNGMRDALLGHLAMEDGQLYPQLVAAAERTGQAGLATVARTFATNMASISTGLIAFFTRYPDGASLQRPTFAREWKSICAVLGDRIQQEESTLYPLHAKLMSGARPGSK